MKFNGFDGETFKPCHALRSGAKYPKNKAEESYDVIIIGAGISGLTAAYTLKDQLAVRVIEKENRIGGASKRGNWKGINYSLGAADTGQTYQIEYKGKKFDFLSKIFKELKIPWKEVRYPSSAFKYRGNIVIDPFCSCHEQGTTSAEVAKSFEDSMQKLRRVLEEYGEPVIPIEASPPSSMSLDRMTLQEVFTGATSPFSAFLNSFSRATFGARADKISAFLGLYYLGRESEKRYACPGGNATVSESLAAKINNKIELNCTAISIEQEDTACYVSFIDGNGIVRTYESKAVIIASEKHYLPHIIKDLPEDQKKAFKKIRYNAYIVANIFTNHIIYNSAFATYFDDAIFGDIVIADWVASGEKNQVGTSAPAVYTLYCPIEENQRQYLLSQPSQFWLDKILVEFERQFPDSRNKIEEIRLQRYGHHYILSGPGFINNRNLIKRPFNNIFFAKDDTQGIPSLESAIWSGLEAANDVLEKLA